MEWQPELVTGQDQIDAEHRSLVDAVNRLHAALDQGKDREEIGKILAFLRDYAVTHFSSEEALMIRAGYPRASAHFAAHADLTLQLSDLLADFRAGRARVTEAVLAFLETWLVEHILRQDQDLGAFVRQRGLEA
jgi:hemerythrin-like metal-binding protein